MINTVEKIYNYIDTSLFEYKITFDNEVVMLVPHNEANRHYQEILEWVENGGVIVDNGA
jgi:hypothetical protein